MYTSTPTKIDKDINSNRSPNQSAQSPIVKAPTVIQQETFPYPVCWQDDQRMAVLMSRFRIRSVNVEHYDAKIKFWQDLIGQYCEHRGNAIFSKRELQLMFARGDRLPGCLDTVLEDMQRTKKIRPLAEYKYDPENSWTGWAINSFVRKPLLWGFTKIKHTVGLADQSMQIGTLEYVHLNVIRHFCKELQTKVLYPQQGKLLHYDVFKELCTMSLHYTEDCLRLCLHALYCQRKIGLEYKQEEDERELHLIKIPSKADVGNVLITEADRAVHNLQMTQQNLLKQLESLEEDIKRNDGKAREFLQENKRQLAKTYLRKKHLLEKNHEKRSIALHNIETILNNVDEAQTNGEILDAYKIGSKALQKALDESGLKYDNVDEVISEVRDTMEAHQELQDTLSNINGTDSAVNNENDELERELQEILGEKAAKTTTQKPRISVAPQVNSNNSKAERQKVIAVNGPASNVPLTENNLTQKFKDISVDISQPHTVKISDAELLAMLQGLDVIDDTVTNRVYNNAPTSTIAD